MSAEEIARMRKRIADYKSERDMRIGKMDQAEQEIKNVLTELETMGLTEETLDKKISSIHDKMNKMKEIVNKKINECEAAIKKE